MFPVRTVSRPACLSGQSNGRLDPSILVSTPGQAGGQEVRLVAPAARAWRALTAAALAAGHVLKPTSLHDSYRPYEVQERIFRQRYTTDYLAGRPFKSWNGQRWYQRPGTAVAAVPGTSNHGWGLAVDTGEERDSDIGTESLDDPTLRWLLDNEERFGFSHEVQSEPWHVRYFAGDDIPQAVLAYEQGNAPAAVVTTKEYDDMHVPALIVQAKGKPEWWLTDGITKQYIASAQYAATLRYIGKAKWDDGIGAPFQWDASTVDAIRRVG